MTDDQSAGDGPKARGIHYVDLVLGAWRPREAALQLAAGLGVALRPDRFAEQPAIDLAIRAEAIDAAALGDPLVDQAWDDASRISAALLGGAVIAVLAPRFDLPLRADNEWFFHFLRRFDRALVVIGEEPPMRAVDRSPFERRRSIVSPEWEVRSDKIGAERMRLLRLFPGLMPRRIAEAADLVDDTVSLIAVSSDRFLVPISYRDTDPRNAAFDFDALDAVEGEDEGFKAFAQCYCTGHFADSAALTDLGLRYLSSGCRDLAHDLLQRARLVARNPASVAQAELARHELALTERRLAGVVAAPALSLRAPAADRDRLQHLKDWARLATGDLSGTDGLIAASLRRLGTDEAIDAHDVIRLDQIVGARYRAGDVEGAKTLARSVAAALAHAGERADPRLVYANALSLIRLYRAGGDLAGLAREIDRAFSTTLGARRASDILLLNALRASAERDQTAPAAAAAWLRAGLAWLCLEPREGLSRDAIETVLGDRIVARADLPGEMARALADALAAAWPAIATTEPRRVPNIHPNPTVAGLAPRHMYAGPGTAVLWSPDAMTSPPSPPPIARLIQLVCAALAQICPPFARIDHGTLSTDTNVGFDIPGNREEALSVALRLDIEEFFFGDERMRLDAATRSRLAADLQVTLSPIVGEVAETGDGVAVTFRRYLPKLTLADGEAQLLAHLRNGESHRLKAMPLFSDAQSSVAVEATLRRLEAAHVVRIDLPPP